MPYRSLADFLEDLAGSGDLARITVEVDPILEISEITDRMARRGGPALLFDRVRGHAGAVVTNLFATEARVCRAAGAGDLDELPRRLARSGGLSNHRGGVASFLGPWSRGETDPHRPVSVKTAPCQQVVRLGRDVDLAVFPFLQSWPQESRRVVRGGMLVAVADSPAWPIVEPHALVVVDSRSLALCWDDYSALARQWRRSRDRGQRMPMAVVLGGDPVWMLAGHLPMPGACDPMSSAGMLRGAPLELVRGRTVELDVPAEAEMVLEGYVEPDTEDVRDDGFAWGAPSGYYHSLLHAPQLRVTAVTHRANFIIPADAWARAPGQGAPMHKLAARMLLPAVRALAPDVVAIHLPSFAPRRQVALVALRKNYPHQARQVVSALWGHFHTMFTKAIIVVDADVDLEDSESILFYLAANVDVHRDIFFHDGPADLFDHAVMQRDARSTGKCRKLGIDATAKLPEECGGTWPRQTFMHDEIRALVSERWREYGLES
jgi:4-hydroxy-3-polyprenylbenzoate decarboxylase